jgi:hypothetical protein
MRKRLGLSATLVSIILLGAGSVSGLDRSCLSDEVLAETGLQVSQDLPFAEDATDLATARSVAELPENRGIAIAGDAGAIREIRLAVVRNHDHELNGGSPVFLFGVHHEGTPRPLFPAGEMEYVQQHGAPIVASPCSVVLVTPAGEHLSTLTVSTVVDER